MCVRVCVYRCASRHTKQGSSRVIGKILKSQLASKFTIKNKYPAHFWEIFISGAPGAGSTPNATHPSPFGLTLFGGESQRERERERERANVCVCVCACVCVCERERQRESTFNSLYPSFFRFPPPLSPPTRTLTLFFPFSCMQSALNAIHPSPCSISALLLPLFPPCFYLFPPCFYLPTAQEGCIAIHPSPVLCPPCPFLCYLEVALSLELHTASQKERATSQKERATSKCDSPVALCYFRPASASTQHKKGGSRFTPIAQGSITFHPRRVKCPFFHICNLLQMRFTLRLQIRFISDTYKRDVYPNAIRIWIYVCFVSV